MTNIKTRYLLENPIIFNNKKKSYSKKYVQRQNINETNLSEFHRFRILNQINSVLNNQQQQK